jgi:hypothetical protein
MTERRRSERVLPPGELYVRVNSRVSARVVDASPLGAQLESVVQIRPSSSCTLVLGHGSDTLCVPARVLRSRAVAVPAGGEGPRLVYRAGLEFLEPESREVATLCQMVTTGQAPSLEPAADAHHSREVS